MTQETPQFLRPDDPADVGKFPVYDGTNVAWTHVQAPLQFAAGGFVGPLFPTATSPRWYNRTGSPIAVAEWHASLGQVSSSGPVTVEVLLDGAATAVATISVAQGANVQANTTQQLTVPAGSYLQTRVTAPGAGAADLVVMAKGVLA